MKDLRLICSDDCFKPSLQIGVDSRGLQVRPTGSTDLQVEPQGPAVVGSGGTGRQVADLSPLPEYCPEAHPTHCSLSLWSPVTANSGRPRTGQEGW